MKSSSMTALGVTMHRQYFPRCPVDGPIEPAVPYEYEGTRGAVPMKCSECPHLYGSDCTRAMPQIHHRLHLDHGACEIDGPTEPVLLDNEFLQSKVYVPQKCATCIFLGVDFAEGFYCTKDVEKWGDFRQGLDWGQWRPARIDFQLPSPKVTTRELTNFAYEDNLVAFVKELRRANPGVSITEAQGDFYRLRDMIESLSVQNKDAT
ncbi:hypothetical protein M4951_06415 [Blastopirellula sp. J2-11]|uniref:hypothetical protein n=1 Tax=Blastopirellula sp. J2-11 TaxID=2943192 RepID=UPI0021C62BBC|nr:hypothetical protein [Blastopirellula sp. J2-11]UUO07944.1 hypothetical protein M4951_06415 [Blastopirellula sp. J2-11]